MPAEYLQVDASAHCQLACPSCPTASGATRPALGAGHLDPDTFEALLRSNPALREIELSNYGEMFLNPRLRDLLRIANEKNVVLHADNGVNFNFAPDAVIEALVRYRFRSMTVSIDGASPETYRQYRVKGDFDQVIANIRRLNALKREQNAAFPVLKWQFIVFGHNEHEIAKARAMAAELDMGFRPKISWDDDVSPIRNRELVQLQLPGRALTREQHRQSTGNDYMRGICLQLWNAPVLNWNGLLTGCCRNFWGDFGANAFADGLDRALNAEPLRYAKAMLEGTAPERDGIPCTTCDLYKTLADSKRWITRDEIETAMVKPGILLGVAVDKGSSVATHVDVFVVAGHRTQPELFVQPPPAIRIDLTRQHAIHFSIAKPGDYLVYILAKQLDPTYRTQYARIPPLTQAITVADRPARQEVQVRL